jgi:hypothetical protein
MARVLERTTVQCAWHSWFGRKKRLAIIVPLQEDAESGAVAVRENDLCLLGLASWVYRPFI